MPLDLALPTVDASFHIIALATCHNRREKTREALRTMFAQWLPPGWTLRVCIVDDGSTDGTGEMVRRQFPQVVCLQGPGNLFWAGGMRFGWDHWVRAQTFHHLLVFNDDVRLKPIALWTLIEAMAGTQRCGTSACAVAGALLDGSTRTTAYSGVRRCHRWDRLRFARVDPSDSIQECDTLNMNFALISREALQRVGFLSDVFTHHRADFDLGLRIRASGGRVVLAPSYVGECSRNSVAGSSKEPGISFRERWRRLTSVKELNVRERWSYYRRHGGVLGPFFYLYPYIRAPLSSLFTRIRGTSSYDSNSKTSRMA